MGTVFSRKRNQLKLERSDMRYYLILSKRAAQPGMAVLLFLLYYLKFQLL